MQKLLNLPEINESFEFEKYRSFLLKEYENYVTSISTRAMAVSMKCCCYFLHLIEKIQPKSVIDFGSGFSSFAIRKYKKITGNNFEIWSVDSDKKWLKKSKVFCKNNNVESDNFYEWSNVEERRFDLIFFDIDKTVKRLDYFAPLFENFCNGNTVILFDDMHKPILRKQLHYELNNLNKEHTFCNTEQITKEGRRFSHLVQI